MDVEALTKRLRDWASPDAEHLSDGYRLTQLIRAANDAADALAALSARVAELERERDEANERAAAAVDDYNDARADLAKARDTLHLYREGVRIDVKMEGPRFMGANLSALKRAWEADLAALAPEGK